jgi:hypothetical protein
MCGVHVKQLNVISPRQIKSQLEGRLIVRSTVNKHLEQLVHLTTKSKYINRNFKCNNNYAYSAKPRTVSVLYLESVENRVTSVPDTQS